MWWFKTDTSKHFSWVEIGSIASTTPLGFSNPGCGVRALYELPHGGEHHPWPWNEALT